MSDGPRKPCSNLGSAISIDQEYQNLPDSDDRDFGDADTISVKSYVLEHVYENGRRYHSYSEGRYMLPNDEPEQDRLDMHHHVFLISLGDKLHLAPIENPQKILDLGTGTGIWAIEMADEHPSAQVIGIDLSPIQPTWVPENCKFVIDDIELPWSFPENNFDFVHSRNLLQSIKNWPRYLENIYKHVQPGGYIDIAELGGVIQSDDDSIPEGSSLARIIKLYAEALKKMGLTHLIGAEMKAFVEAAGFTDVELHLFKQPIGGWPRDPILKKVGLYQQISCETGFEAYTLALLTRALGMTNEDVAKLTQGTIKDIRNRRIHSYIYFYHVVARKPMK